MALGGGLRPISDAHCAERLAAKQPLVRGIERRSQVDAGVAAGQEAGAYTVEDIACGHAMGEREPPFECAFEIDTVGALQGFVGYFSAELVDAVTLTNFPCYPGCHWENWH